VRLERPDVVLAFDDAGEPGRTPLVMLHGLGDARSTWCPFLVELASRHRVLALDFRGHGESGHASGNYTLKHFVADAVALCDEVLEQPAVVVGHSLGGVVALSMAQQRPELVRGLLLEDPPLFPKDDSPALPFFSFLREFVQSMQARQAPVEEYESAWSAVPSRDGRRSVADVLGPERTHARALAMSRIDPDVFLPALDRTGLEGARPDDPVSCPVYVIRADPSLGALFTADDEKRFRAANPRAELTVVLDATHLVHQEQPERFASHLDAWLGRL
jgi:pimeloyl-ACP methyl ester carboxylesterase